MLLKETKMKKNILLPFLCIAIVIITNNFSLSCEKYQQYPVEELKNARKMLLDVNADPFDRSFAFDILSCSNDPALRHFAIKTGLENVNDSLIRSKILLKALVQKKRIDIELGSNSTLSERDKEFVERHGGVYSKLVVATLIESGCVSLRELYEGNCDSSRSMFIHGDTVEFNYEGVTGKFTLSKAGELVGYIKAEMSNNYGKIPAVRHHIKIKSSKNYSL